MASFNCYVTNAGRSMLAAAQAGGTSITLLYMSSGNGTITLGQDPNTFTSLIHPIQNWQIDGSNSLTPYQTTVQFTISSANITSQYQMTEVGMFAQVPSGSPTLVWYGYAPIPDTLTPTGSGNATIDINQLAIVFTNETTCVATFNPNVVVPPHAITHILPGGFDPIPVASYTASGLTPKTNNNAAQVLLGGATAAFGTLPAHGPTHVSTGSDPVPVVTTNYNALCPRLSGDVNTFLSGVGTYIAANFPGVVVDYGGSLAPAGWLLCNGQSYPTIVYPGLFAVIGYTFGGSGVNFNVPDARGRVTVGAGAGAGLTNRVLGSTYGEELHVLSADELPYHTHTAAAADHQHYVPQLPTYTIDHSHTASGHAIDHIHTAYGYAANHYHYFSGATIDHAHSASGGAIDHAHYFGGGAGGYGPYKGINSGRISAAAGSGLPSSQFCVQNSNTHLDIFSAYPTEYFDPRHLTDFIYSSGSNYGGGYSIPLSVAVGGSNYGGGYSLPVSGTAIDSYNGTGYSIYTVVTVGGSNYGGGYSIPVSVSVGGSNYGGGYSLPGYSPAFWTLFYGGASSGGYDIPVSVNYAGGSGGVTVGHSSMQPSLTLTKIIKT